MISPTRPRSVDGVITDVESCFAPSNREGVSQTLGEWLWRVDFGFCRSADAEAAWREISA